MSMFLEQERRDFKAAYPDLYEYVANFEAAKELDSLGDAAGGLHTGYQVANLAWQRCERLKDRCSELRTHHG